MRNGLGPGELADFERYGYLVVDGVLTAAELAALEAEYAAILDRVLPELADRGLIHLPERGTFGERFVAALAQLDDIYDLYRHLDISLPQSVIGPEIYSNPVQHARIKPPRRGVHRRRHRGGTAPHCPGKVFPAEIYIPDVLVDEQRVVPLEVGAGGLALLHKRTAHGSLDNETDEIRWSFDLRYQPIGQPTGRDVFPGFVARSAVHPVLDDADDWARLWWEARDRIVAGDAVVSIGGRWNPNAAQPVCA